MNTKKQLTWKYGFATISVLVGILFNFLKLKKDFLGFASVGNWLIYIGFVMFAVITLQLLSKKKKLVDERMVFVATKASRITFLAIILSAFIIMVVDGINTIYVPYSYFMSYFICGIVFIYFISYKILLRYN